MNKKHKNKNRSSKPSNPVPDPVSKETEAKPTVEEPVVIPVEGKPQIQESEPIIESVSEVTSPITAQNDLVGETPKKPKRNKGKKKKQDESHLDESKLTPEIAPLPDSEVKDEDKKEIPEIKEIKEKEGDKKIEDDITPNVRKKKNKKKQNEPPQVVEDKPKDTIPIETLQAEETEKNVPSPELPEPVPTESESKQIKKKNKKKKHRHDSEKSDKADETVTCTSAFQKLMGSGETEGELVKSEEMSDDRVAKEAIEESIKADVPEEENLKELIQSVLMPDEPQESQQESLKDDLPKGKKKNKKDKKQQQKQEPVKTNIIEEHKTEESLVSDTEMIPKEIKNESVQKVETSITMPPDSVPREPSPKPKAKIAKPVEKKRKGKTETAMTDTKDLKSCEDKSESTEQIDAPKRESPKPITEVEDHKEDKSVTLESGNVDTTIDDNEDQKIETPVLEMEQKKIEDFLLSVTKETPSEIPTIVNIPAEEKEHTKVDDIPSSIEEKTSDFIVFAEDDIKQIDLTSPTNIMDLIAEKVAMSSDQIIPHVMPTTEPVPVKSDQLLEMDSNMPLISPTTTEPKNKDANITSEFVALKPDEFFIKIDSDIPLISATTTESEEKDRNIPKQSTPVKSDQILGIDSNMPHISPTITEPENKDRSARSVSETKKEKKKKRHSNKIDTKSSNVSTESTPDYKVLLTPDCTQDKNVEKENVDVFFDSPSAGDVEISTAKAEDIEGSSDVTPDFVHHPLSTSQQFIDNNNNMVIREVTTPEEKTTLPLLIPTVPIIQGSGETPEPLSETVTMTPKITRTSRERSKTNEPEKTDLKSKMMEVSQDMEELRLSIERSLAELTSMERSEQEIEKKFEEKPQTQNPPEPTLNITEQVNLLQPKNEPVDECDKDILVQESLGVKLQFESENIESKIEKPDFTPDNDKSDNKQNIDTPNTAPGEQPKMVPAEKEAPPVAPARKEHKGKGKGKRKGKQETQSQQPTSTSQSSSVTTTERTSQDVKKEEKPEQEQKSSDNNQNKGKQQALKAEIDYNGGNEICEPTSMADQFEPIEYFEDALTSSVDDVNKTFELIASEANSTSETTFQNPEINIIAPTEDTEKDVKPKQNPVSPPKNLLGHPDIPVPSNRTDYKKEKNKPPNTRQARVKIKDAVDIEKEKPNKKSKQSQTENKVRPSKDVNVLESFTYITNENEEYVYKYSFRKVFLQSLCHVCRKTLSQRVPCQFCSLVFYCSQKHKDEDWPQHQSLCFVVCTIVHLKDQKHIYADAKNITGQNYRLLRMQMIVSCEKVLKRKLVPWEQEALLYPRICADVTCREWKQGRLADCVGCGQISYCTEHPDHLPSTHQRWCKSYALYQKLVHHQQTKGRLEPKLPTRVLAEGYQIPETMNEVLALMYEEKIDMSDTEYAALTQLATAPLTAAYCHQLYTCNIGYANGMSRKTSFIIHIVGAELQFEADVLHKWETFFLHLKPDIKELKVVLINPELNPSNLPLDLLGKINICENCITNNRRVLFSFQDKKTYHGYWSSDEFISPDIVCAFNPSIQRSSTYGKDTWPTTISCILKLKTPFIITSYSLNELNRDLSRIKECSRTSEVSYNVISEGRSNSFASVRPDRNFITDHEMPLLFKNYCFAVLSGV